MTDLTHAGAKAQLARANNVAAVSTMLPCKPQNALVSCGQMTGKTHAEVNPALGKSKSCGAAIPAAFYHRCEDRGLVLEADRLLQVAPGLVAEQRLQQESVRTCMTKPINEASHISSRSLRRIPEKMTTGVCNPEDRISLSSESTAARNPRPAVGRKRGAHPTG